MPVGEARHITVVGSGTSTALPDAVWLQLGAETRAETPAGALDECARALAAMASVLRERGVAESALRTGQLTVEPEWQHTEMDHRPRVVGYSASTTLGVTVRELPDAGSLATAALEAAGTAGRLHGMRLDLTDPGVPAADARAAAYADARAKAEQYAELAGVELGDLLSLSEHVERGHQRAEMLSSSLSGGFDRPIEIHAGESTIAAAVTATWALI